MIESPACCLQKCCSGTPIRRSIVPVCGNIRPCVVTRVGSPLENRLPATCRNYRSCSIPIPPSHVSHLPADYSPATQYSFVPALRNISSPEIAGVALASPLAPAILFLARISNRGSAGSTRHPSFRVTT